MGFACGIVGLPNVGKSTLFNALTEASIQAENYPFCTIEPNVGIVPVPDKRLDQLAAMVNPKKVIPTGMRFVDIAGLVAGASKGEGLGNRFLANIRETDAIVHVVRCFENDDITHVSGKVSPMDDIEIIQTELLLSDLETIDKGVLRLGKLSRSGDKKAKAQLGLYEQLQAHADEGKQLRSFSPSDEQQTWFNELNLLTTKPTVYVANVDEGGFEDNAMLKTVRDYAKEHDDGVVPICAVIEAELLQMPMEERTEFLAEMGMGEPGLHRVINAGYGLLNLQTYFTAGPKEVRAWTIPMGATAPQAAGKIHTDFERGFIRAEVISFEDYIKLGGESAARVQGRLRQEGRDYIVHDGDVIHFKFNV